MGLSSSPEIISNALNQRKENLQKMPKAQVIDDLLEKLKTAKPQDIISAFVKTVKDSGINATNKEQMANFMQINFNPKFVKRIQVALVNSGIDVAYKTSKGKTVSGLAACDGLWGDASQNAINQFLANQIKKQQEDVAKSRAENYKTNVADHFNKLKTFSQTLIIPADLKKDVKKLDTILMILAQGNNDSKKGLTETQFHLDESDNEKISAAVKNLSKIIKAGGKYRVESIRLGEIEINGVTVRLWSENDGNIDQIPQEETKKIPLTDRKKFIRAERKLREKMREQIIDKVDNLLKYSQLPKEVKIKTDPIIKSIRSSLNSLSMHGRDFGSLVLVDIELDKDVSNVKTQTDKLKSILNNSNIHAATMATIDELNVTANQLFRGAMRVSPLDGYKPDFNVPISYYNQVVKLINNNPDEESN